MGGMIQLAIRLQDGTEYIHNGWTNSSNYQLINHETLLNPLETNPTLQQWIQHPEQDEKINFNVEYGIIIIDYQEQKLLSCNSYANQEYRLYSPLNGPEVNTWLLHQLDQGWLTDITGWQQQEFIKPEIFREVLLHQTLNAELGQMGDANMHYYKYQPPGWQIQHLDHESANYITIQKYLTKYKWKTSYQTTKELIESYRDDYIDNTTDEEILKEWGQPTELRL